MRSMRLYVVASALAGLACSGDDGPSDPSEPGNGNLTVTVTNNQFTPSALSVPVNSTVTWQWNSGGVAHNVTFQDGSPGSASLTSGSFPRMFTAAGSFPYMCTLHPGMAGSVSVTASTGGGGGDTGGDGGGGDYP
jgi:plastocyanin